MTQATRNIHFTDEPGPDTQVVENVYADNLPEGGDPYVLPAATTEALGGVKKAATVAAVAAADATSTASTETVNPAEFAAAVTLLNECKQRLNSVIANEKSAGQMA